jgi:peroxiredoxin
MLAPQRLPVLLAPVALLLATLLPAPAHPGGGDDPFASLLDKPAPQFEGDFVINGKDKSLADLKGKVVLVNFFAAWSPPCINCLSRWRDWQTEYQIKGFETVGVTIYGSALNKKLQLDAVNGQVTAVAGALPKDAEQALLKEFAKRHQIDFRVLVLAADEGKKTIAAYKIKDVPLMVLIDRAGVVRAVQVGSSADNLTAMEKTIERVLKEKK